METRDPGGPRPRRTEPAGLAPVRAFFLVCALATVLGGAFFATREATPSEPGPPAPVRSPDYSLTDEEAVAEFERLNDALMSAYRRRDETLVKTFAAPGSHLGRDVEREIRALLSDGVRDHTKTRTISIEVLENAPTLVRIEHVVIESPRFVDERTGDDVTRAGQAQRQTVVWTLEQFDTRWLLADATIIAAEAVGDRGG
jgi:hypothetical protein